MLTALKKPAPTPIPAARPDQAVPALPDDLWSVDQVAVAATLSRCDLTLETYFQASHITPGASAASTRHTHVFRVQLTCALAQHNPGAPLPFHVVRERLDGLARSYVGRHLNDLPPFRSVEPTTEHLTAVLFCQLERLLADLPLTVEAVTVYESPTQAATCRRPRPV